MSTDLTKYHKIVSKISQYTRDELKGFLSEIETIKTTVREELEIEMTDYFRKVLKDKRLIVEFTRQIHPYWTTILVKCKSPIFRTFSVEVTQNESVGVIMPPEFHNMFLDETDDPEFLNWLTFYTKLATNKKLQQEFTEIILNAYHRFKEVTDIHRSFSAYARTHPETEEK